ncbi:putative CMP-sialic acid transporter [Leptomonas seymouri]|uniref:Putative CMP-sialic acid transporter n=1 Tax=Leptomonas seymouri TaxID=5684 RepID=A0A0N0P7L9_LEPSE|nr:putative CMP-sialic acid transporter [Leptomonas seymouri]|eukprot:KPI88926.1 putative CMP-sialic acid transporter [Leptomonas seymouri]
MPSLIRALRRRLFNFSTIALILLAFQNAGYIVLMGYAQKLQDVPPSFGQPTKKKFAPAHFLAITEVLKLLICNVWCMAEVLIKMQAEEQEAVHQELIYVECDEPSSDNRAARDSYGYITKPHHLHHNGVKVLGTDKNHSSKMNASPLDPAFPSKSTAFSGALSRRLWAHPNFLAEFASRMRHAIGLDEKYKEVLLMIVPAVLYIIQGLLLIVALRYLDPTVFQILYQVRIMFLAVMMRTVLDLQLSAIRWAALVALMVGIVLAQLAMQRKEKEGKTSKTHTSWSIEGTLAALAGAFLSSFSGVFTEYVYKKRGNLFTLSARSVHLALFSLVYFFFVFARDAWWSAPGEVSKHSGMSAFLSTFFDGFTGLVWFLVVLQALGGILVGLVVRYCNNIVKSFSTAFAIVLSGTASVFLFDLPLEPVFLLGSFLVISSITVYSLKK